MASRPRSASAIEKHGALTEHRLALRARSLGIREVMRSISGNEPIEFGNRDLSAAINIRRCAVPEKRLEDLTRSSSMGQPLRIEAFLRKLEAIECNRPKRLAGVRASVLVAPIWSWGIFGSIDRIMDRSGGSRTDRFSDLSAERPCRGAYGGAKSVHCRVGPDESLE